MEQRFRAIRGTTSVPFPSAENVVVKSSEPAPKDPRSDIKYIEAVAGIAKISKTLLQEFEAGRIVHASDFNDIVVETEKFVSTPTTREKLLDVIFDIKIKFAHLKEEAFWKVVRFAKKALNIPNWK